MRAGSTCLLALTLAACTRPDAAPTPAATATATPAATATATPAATASAPIPVPPPLHFLVAAPPCRILSSTSDAGAVGDPVTTWLTLSAGTRITVKEPATGRELILLGPARALPCAHPAQTFLARGRFDSSLGSGESPGAEEWIVTPFAVVRYGASLVSVTVDDAGTRAVAKSGQASALAAGATEWAVLDPTHPFVAAADPHADAAARTRAARNACDLASSAVLGLEGALADAGSGPALGDLAVRASVARTLARAACAVAEVSERSLRP